MDIKLDESGLTVLFEESTDKIKFVKFDDTGFCRVCSKSDELVSAFQTVCSPAYNRQYGTPLSFDEKYLFVGSWEKGLYCYEIQSGKLKWKKTPGKVRRIFVDKESLIIEMGGRGIYKRDIITGELLQEIKMPNIEFISQISHNEIFCGQFRNNYFIYEIPNLVEKHAIKLSSLNINDCLSFCILDSKKENDTLIISGWEQYPNRDYTKKGIVKFSLSITI